MRKEIAKLRKKVAKIEGPERKRRKNQQLITGSLPPSRCTWNTLKQSGLVGDIQTFLNSLKHVKPRDIAVNIELEGAAAVQQVNDWYITFK